MSNKTDVNLPLLDSCSVAVIGLGYVGLPLAVELSKARPSEISGKLLSRKVIGFDINEKRIDELSKVPR